MKYRSLLIAAVLALAAVSWIIDRSRLNSEIATFKRDLKEQELLQDVAEFKLFNELKPGQAVDSHLAIRALADDVIRPGHPGFDLCCNMLEEQFPEVSASFEDCETYVFDVSLDAVPFRGGSYLVVTRGNCILLAFQYVATIGG